MLPRADLIIHHLSEDRTGAPWHTMFDLPPGFPPASVRYRPWGVALSAVEFRAIIHHFEPDLRPAGWQPGAIPAHVHVDTRVAA